jgi:hypothetical protein
VAIASFDGGSDGSMKDERTEVRPEQIFADVERQLVIEAHSQPPDALIQLLDRTEWGTAGLRYVMHGKRAELARIKKAHYVALRVRGELVATVTLVEKTLRIGSRRHAALFVYCLATAAGHTDRGYAELVAGQAMRHFMEQRPEVLIYSFIESQNTRSLSVARRTGAFVLGSVEAVNLSRLAPRDANGVERLKATQRAELSARLSQAYQDYLADDFSEALHPEDYWVLLHRGEIVAGAQALVRSMSITQMRGAIGRAMLTLEPLLGRLNPFFRLRNRSFLMFENLYAQPGHMRDLVRLLDALLNRHRLTSGVLYCDPRGALYQGLRQSGAFGLFYHAAPTSTLQVVVRSQRLNDDERAELSARPLLLSG